MSRRRHKLQVAIFPFLSVLLCVLGSLILLLLVLDRKAKMGHAAQVAAERKARYEADARQVAEARRRQEADAARRQTDLARASERQAEEGRQFRSARRKAGDDARETAAEMARWLANLEFERENQRVAQEREKQRAGLRAQLDRLRAEEAGHQKALASQEAELAALQAELARRQELIAQMGQAAAARQDQAAKVRQDQAKGQQDLARLQEQVLLLERAVAQAREASKSRPPLFYLLPAEARRGSRRPPVFIECRDGRAYFRPGDTALTMEERHNGARLKAEILRRQPGGPGTDAPYLMMIVRPSAVSLYYEILEALGDSGVDVGYELVAEDWALDFSGLDAPPPAEVALGKAQAEEATAPEPGPPVTGVVRREGGRGGEAASGGTAGGGVAGARAGGVPGGIPGGGVPGPVGGGGYGPPGRGSGLAGGPAPRPFPTGGDAQAPPGGPGGGTTGSAGGGGNGPPGGERPGLAGGGQPFPGGENGAPPGAGAPGGADLIEPPGYYPRRPVATAPVYGGSPSANAAPAYQRPAEGGAMASRPAVLGPMDRARGMTGSGGASGGPGTASTRGGPLTPPPQDGMPPGPPAGERPVGPAGLPGERQGLASPIPANERPAPAPGIAAPRPVNLNGEAAQAPRLVGGVDRDWVITVECNGTGVSIPSRKQAFDWLALSKPDLPLQRFVLDMVRVQRDRQPDVRPSLNYVIMVDGLRAYYQAARQLEALGLPVTVEERKPAPPAAPGPR